MADDSLAPFSIKPSRKRKRKMGHALPFSVKEEDDEECDRGVGILRSGAPLMIESLDSKLSRLKNDGNVLAESGLFNGAILRWRTALDLLPPDDVKKAKPSSSTDEQQKQPCIRAVLLELSAQAYLMLGEYWSAVMFGERAVSSSPSWAAAHLTLGRARRNYGELQLAADSLQQALELVKQEEQLQQQQQQQQQADVAAVAPCEVQVCTSEATATAATTAIAATAAATTATATATPPLPSSSPSSSSSSSSFSSSSSSAIPYVNPDAFATAAAAAAAATTTMCTSISPSATPSSPSPIKTDSGSSSSNSNTSPTSTDSSSSSSRVSCWWMSCREEVSEELGEVQRLLLRLAAEGNPPARVQTTAATAAPTTAATAAPTTAAARS